MELSTPNNLLLYFEDDQALSELIIKVLKANQYEVVHYQQFPEDGIQAIKDRLPKAPDVVLLDVKMPGMDGYEVCRQLRDDYLDENTPVIFVSGLIEQDDILKAYAAGADDYLTKPLRMQELPLRIEQLRKLMQQRRDIKEQADMAMKMAFDAMNASSELGDILRFQEAIHGVKQFSDIAALAFSVLQSLQVQGAFLFFAGDEEYYRDDGRVVNLERQSMQEARDKGRIYSWKQFSFFNYQYYTVLIRDMPIHNEERYGVLKDQLCLLFNGIDARIESILIERSNEAKQKSNREVAAAIAAMVQQIEENNALQAERFEKTFLTLEANISTELVQFNLLEHEEKALTDHIATAVAEASALFEDSMKKEREYKAIMTKLIKRLRE
ncbi:response regulator [Aliiglaciecola sp. CAU 1673]|uniref:response regulator transcription factor n=1 Tax=Aliiglaciecola sp. CAU 1673 TaxID=3032595 RepID=UPI0023DB9418|nr:response regulator [Aliiglaciecola sp. CAU 1673]MDF2177090.1 response regulator [Aliiglaciecola sp. CAU 1673]